MTDPAYYGRPILKPPVWKREIGWYLFTGGLAGASATMSAIARASGNPVLARRTALVATAAVNVSPALLVKDLGRPERFLNMMRVFKPSSPMNLGSWVLLASGAATTSAAALDLAGVAPRLRTGLGVAAGLAGVPLSVYTAVLLSDTANPAWHEARHELPFLFAAGAAAGAGAAGVLTTPAEHAGPARRAMLLGTALVLAGAVATRFSVFKAGFQAAEDPRYVLDLQRSGPAAGSSQPVSQPAKRESPKMSLQSD
jgi:formate-dependent nitrite reductase membrane component NrfD